MSSKTLLSFGKKFFIFVAIVTGAILILLLLSYITEPEIKVSNIRITNLTDSSATVSWLSADPSIGSVLVSENNKFDILSNFRKARFYDDRDSDTYNWILSSNATSRYTHHVTITNLVPESKYYYRIAGSYRTVEMSYPDLETGKTLDTLVTPDPSYGQFPDQSENDALIYYSIGDSTQLSTYLNSSFAFTFDKSNLRSKDLLSSYAYRVGDVINISTIDSSSKRTIESKVGEDQPIQLPTYIAPDSTTKSEAPIPLTKLTVLTPNLVQNVQASCDGERQSPERYCAETKNGICCLSKVREIFLKKDGSYCTQDVSDQIERHDCQKENTGTTTTDISASNSGQKVTSSCGTNRILVKSISKHCDKVIGKLVNVDEVCLNGKVTLNAGDPTSDTCKELTKSQQKGLAAVGKTQLTQEAAASKTGITLDATTLGTYGENAGTPKACAAETDQEKCTAIPGCTYYESDKICIIRPGSQFSPTVAECAAKNNSSDECKKLGCQVVGDLCLVWQNSVYNTYDYTKCSSIIEEKICNKTGSCTYYNDYKMCGLTPSSILSPSDEECAKFNVKDGQCTLHACKLNGNLCGNQPNTSSSTPASSPTVPVSTSQSGTATGENKTVNGQTFLVTGTYTDDKCKCGQTDSGALFYCGQTATNTTSGVSYRCSGDGKSNTPIEPITSGADVGITVNANNFTKDSFLATFGNQDKKEIPCADGTKRTVALNVNSYDGINGCEKPICNDRETNVCAAFKPGCQKQKEPYAYRCEGKTIVYSPTGILPDNCKLYKDVYCGTPLAISNKFSSPVNASAVLGVSTTSSVTVNDTGTYNVSGIEGYNITTGAIKIIDQKPGGIEIKFFYDLNGDGIKQDNEQYVTEPLQVKVDKVSDISTIDLKVGWNLVGNTVVVSGLKTAKDLLNEINKQGGYATHISTYRNGKWVMYSQRAGIQLGNNFNLVPGEGYFIRIHKAVKLVLEGNKVASGSDYYMSTGWNLISLVPDKDMKASGLIDKINKNSSLVSDVVTRYSSGRYENLVKDSTTSYGTDFSLNSVEGYFVRMVKGGVVFKL
ncbi:MAG: fibronectin type III domain-containing protein [bacterium]